MEEREGQRLILGAGKNRNQKRRKSTPHFGRVSHNRIRPCVCFDIYRERPPQPRLEASTGHTSLPEVLVCLFLTYMVAILI